MVQAGLSTVCRMTHGIKILLSFPERDTGDTASFAAIFFDLLILVTISSVEPEFNFHDGNKE